jgi:hypothetical protein
MNSQSNPIICENPGPSQAGRRRAPFQGSALRAECIVSLRQPAMPTDVSQSTTVPAVATPSSIGDLMRARKWWAERGDTLVRQALADRENAAPGKNEQTLEIDRRHKG